MGEMDGHVGPEGEGGVLGELGAPVPGEEATQVARRVLDGMEERAAHLLGRPSQPTREGLTTKMLSTALPSSSMALQVGCSGPPRVRRRSWSPSLVKPPKRTQNA
ncbi:hypothetical protein GCM10018953_51240 [Streptosporangium nondiastaticum]